MRKVLFSRGARVAVVLSLILALGSVSPSVNAQSSSQPQADLGQTLTLSQAVMRARQNPPAVLIAAAQARAAQAQVPLARASLLPLVTGTLSGTASVSNGPSNVIPGANAAFGYISGDANLSERWTIWDFGRTSLNVAAAQQNALGAQQDLRSAERSAIAIAVAAYYTLLADQELIASFQETVRQRSREFDITHGLVEAGTHAPIEELRAQITLANAQLDVTSAQTSWLNDTASLAAALALDPARPVQITQPAELTVDDDPIHAADAAVATRPEITAARVRVESAESQFRATRAAWRPSLFLNGTAGAGVLEYLFSPGMSGTGNANVRENASAQAGITVPIFDPTITPQVRAAEANVEISRANLAAQTLSVRTDAAQSAIQVRSARQVLAQAEQVAGLAAANLAQAEGRYRAGAAQLLELVDAQGADATARLGVVRSRFQLELAKVRLLTSLARIGELEGRH